MSKITACDKSLLHLTRDETVLVEPYGDNTVRVRATRNGQIADERWTLEEALPAEVEIAAEGGFASLKNGSLTVEMRDDWGKCRLRFLRDGEEILRTREEGDSSTRYCYKGGDLWQVRALFEAREDEHFYGLGQEQQSYFDRKGSSYDLMHYNTKASLPGVYSSLGYYFLWNNPAPGHVKLGRNRTLWQSDTTKQADYVVVAADTPACAMKRYAELIGFAPEMPEWAAGFWQSRLRYALKD